MNELLTDTFSKLTAQFSSFFSNFIGAGLILFIGWIIAKIAAYIVKNVFSKIGVDKIGDKIKEIETIRKFNLDFKLSTILSKIVFIFIMLFLAVSAADKLGVPAISNMFHMIVDFIPKLIVACVMSVIGIFLADLARNFVETLCKSFNIASGKLLGMGVFGFILFIAVILALGQAGINTSLLESSFNIIIAGLVLAFSIGYGFASKEILLNIVSGFYSKTKINIGQEIEIDGVKGRIVSIDNTSLTVKTEAGNTVFPLKKLQNEKFTLVS